MQPISYTRPLETRAAIAGSDGDSAFYAGGTTLIDLMKLDVLTPRSLLDINHLPFAQIEYADGRLRLGALARMSDTADHPAVKEFAPAVAQALSASASAQLRNMASLGGNIMQRTRCAYFRDVATPCNKRRPGSGCGARAGISEEHAILGTSDACIATHASDFAVPLAAFDAVLGLTGPGGSRRVPITEFYFQPGPTPELESALLPAELIEWIEIAVTPAVTNSVYVKVRDRTSYAFALASCAAGIARAADGTIAQARIALGGVGTIPWRARAAEELLLGKAPAGDLFAAAARAVFKDAKPTAQNAYKQDLGIATIVRALEAVTA